MKKTVDFMRLPMHIAITMDGNGRWAKKWLVNRKAGHKAGAQTLKKLAEKMNNAGFKILTVFAFSTENWSRSEDEVSYLMNLIREYIQQYIDDTEKNNMRINVIGDISRLDNDLQERIEYLKNITRNHDGMCINIAINYGGRDEILRTVKKIGLGIVDKSLNVDDINENIFNSYLDTAEFPDPDLLIRTSGEMRISNFMLWQLSYTELYFSDKLWPDFTYDDLLLAVIKYQSRERRFGRRIEKTKIQKEIRSNL